MQIHTRPSPWLGAVAFAGLALLSTRVDAQGPAMWSRARSACDAAAARAGYVVLSRTRPTLVGNSYTFPWHVRRGNVETDIVCRYDGVRGLVDLPGFERERTESGILETQEMRAARRCENYVNAISGYEVEDVGSAVRRGNTFSVPLTVERRGHDVHLTCRFNPITNRVSLRSY